METFDLSSLFFEGKKLPEILYHYTSVPSFVNMIEKDAQLYATHFVFLNDEIEMKNGQLIFDDFLQ